MQFTIPPRWSLHLLLSLSCLWSLLPKCYGCEPGAIQLSRWLTRDLSIDKLQQMPNRALSIRAVGNSTKLFYNGIIITMAGGGYSPAEAVVSQGDTITYTGTLAGARQIVQSNAESVDLQGRTMLPGFVEPHLHLILSAFADHYLLNLSPLQVTTLDDALQRIRQAPLLNGTWVAGYGCDPSRVANHPDLTLDMLNSVRNGIPVFILNQSGHVAYVNSLALAAANVTADSVANDPNYQKDAQGKLTGILFETAVNHVALSVPVPQPQQILRDCNLTLQTWISRGCTTVFDAGIGSVSGKTDVALMAALFPSPIRMHGALANYILPPVAASSPSQLPSPPRPFRLGQIDITSVKYWADGSTQGFTAALKQPYLSPPSWALNSTHLNYANSTTLERLMAPWAQAGFQILVHSNGDNATDLTLDAYQGLLANTSQHSVNGAAPVHRIEHFTVVEDSQIYRAKAMGLGVSHTIGHVKYWGTTFRDYVLGPDRAARVDPLRTDTDAGLLWSLHSDSPVTPVDPLGYVATAVTRKLYNCTAIEGLHEDSCVLGTEQKVSLLDALKSVTINPATQIGVESTVGTLEVGKKADMVILDQDLRELSLDNLAGLEVRQTWIGGEMVYQMH